MDWHDPGPWFMMLAYGTYTSKPEVCTLVVPFCSHMCCSSDAYFDWIGCYCVGTH